MLIKKSLKTPIRTRMNVGSKKKHLRVAYEDNLAELPIKLLSFVELFTQTSTTFISVHETKS
jgi:hypothetical protein